MRNKLLLLLDVWSFELAQDGFWNREIRSKWKAIGEASKRESEWVMLRWCCWVANSGCFWSYWAALRHECMELYECEAGDYEKRACTLSKKPPQINNKGSEAVVITLDCVILNQNLLIGHSVTQHTASIIRPRQPLTYFQQVNDFKEGFESLCLAP